MKRRFRLFTTLLLIFIFMTSAASKAFATSEPGNEQYLKIMEQQEAAVAAYQNMMHVFDPSGAFDFDYPIEYAGAYVSENNHLVICLTDVNDEYISKYQKLCQNSTVLEFKTVKFSYSELEGLAKSIYKDTGEKNISSVSISARNNNICIGMDSNNLDTKASEIKTKIKEKSKFNLKGSSTPPINIEYRKKAEKTTSLIGGSLIMNSGGVGFTLGVCGTYNGSPAFYTCGHAFSYVGNYAYDTSGAKIGEVVAHQYNNGQYYDYAVVKITNTNYTTTNKVWGSAATKISITGVYTYPVEGTTVYKYGATASYAYGQVAASNTSVSYDNGSTVIWGLTQVTLTNGTIATGDSGGPCYFSNKISGVISGRSGSTTMYYSPILSGAFQVKTS